MATKKTLQTKLKSLGIEFKSRATKDELEALLKKAEAKKHSGPSATQATKRGPSAKQMLRGMFDKEGKTIPVEEVEKELSHCKPATITTMCGDLRNPKYAQGETIDIRKEGDNYVRVH